MKSPVEVEVVVPPMETQVCFGPEGQLVPEEMLGDASVDVFVKVVDALCENEKVAHKRLHEIVDSPQHRLDIVRKFERLIPEDGALSVSPSDTKRLFRLAREKKDMAFEIAAKEEKELVTSTEDVRTLTGPVVEARIVDKRHFVIGNLECRFEEKDVPTVQGLLGKVVSLTGKAIIKNDKIVEFAELLNISPIEEWRFSEIAFEDRRISLSRPLIAMVSFEESAIWIRDNLGLDIIGVGESWTDALADFNSEFAVALAGYATQPDDKLTEDAIKLREKLRKLVPKWKEVLKDVADIQ
jgi:hypothetical protein